MNNVYSYYYSLSADSLHLLLMNLQEEKETPAFCSRAITFLSTFIILNIHNHVGKKSFLRK